MRDWERLPFGRSGFLFVFSEASGFRARRAENVRRRLRRSFPGFEFVVGDHSLLVSGPGIEARLEEFEEECAAELASPSAEEGTLHEFQAVYDGLDFDEAARTLGLPRQGLVELHSKALYTVEFTGFLPGFGYLSGGDERLRLPRRSVVRPRVLAGSLAVAAHYSAIYPHDSPGGWTLLGRVLAPGLFESSRDPASRLAPGDRVKFVPASAPSEGSVIMRARARPEKPALRIVSAPPLTTIQDAGRFGRLGEGLPVSGPLDPEAYAAATASVESEGSAAIEFSGGKLVIEALAPVEIAIDDEASEMLLPGERRTFEEGERAARYLALRGGFDVPRVLGSRSTLLVARLGGWLGRTLRAGDELGRGNTLAPGVRVSRKKLKLPLGPTTLWLDPGPHYGAFSSEARRRLREEIFTVGRAGDRTGRTLDDGALGEHTLASVRSVPVLRGSIQVTPRGTPIVLGPDHPTTGGYPVIAVLRPESFGAFGRLRPDAKLRFSFEAADEAR